MKICPCNAELSFTVNTMAYWHWRHFTFSIHGMLSVFIILLYNYTLNCYGTVLYHACICVRFH